jgi:hypothetical protein
LQKRIHFIPVNGTYTCRMDTTFVSQHINTLLTLNVTATADAAQFIPRGQVAPRGAQHFQSDLCKGRGDFCRSSASFCGLCPYTRDLTYPHTKKSGGVKSGDFAGHGMDPSRLHQWYCARCCGVTAMFVSHALAPPRGHAAEPPVNLPFAYTDILPAHKKLLRDTYINFLYTMVYFSNISNGSHCISCEQQELQKDSDRWRNLHQPSPSVHDLSVRMLILIALL